MADFKEIKKFIELYVKRNYEKFGNLSKTNNKISESILKGFLEELKIHIEKNQTVNSSRKKLPHRRKGYT